MRLLSLAVAALLTVAASAALPGCGGGAVEFDKSADYTPESLAQEFLFRYKELPERATGRKKARAAAQEKARANAPASVDQVKSQRAEAAKKADVPTLERLIAETEAKLARVPGLSASEAGRKVAERIATDPAILPDDLEEIRARLAK